MTLQEFLKEVNGDESDIVTIDNPLEAVKRDGYALRYIKEQSSEICLEAVKQDGDSLQFVDKTIFDTDVIEMTIGEIEDKLGLKIKIIKGV